MATTMTDYAAEREAMVERQLKRRGITEKLILDAFLKVPRECFVSEEYAHLPTAIIRCRSRRTRRSRSPTSSR